MVRSNSMVVRSNSMVVRANSMVVRANSMVVRSKFVEVAMQFAIPTCICSKVVHVQMVKGLGAPRGVRALPAAVCWVQCSALKVQVVASLFRGVALLSEPGKRRYVLLSSRARVTRVGCPRKGVDRTTAGSAPSRR